MIPRKNKKRKVEDGVGSRRSEIDGAVCSGKKIGAYLSDITGAFDRVFKSYFLGKLQQAGVGTMYLNFLDAYLALRKGKVVVQGSSSEEFVLEDTVFQGTVFGPPLWNSFFADVADPASAAKAKKPYSQMI